MKFLKKLSKNEEKIQRIFGFRISSGVYGQPLNTYNQTFRNIVSLVNFRQRFPAVAA